MAIMKGIGDEKYFRIHGDEGNLKRDHSHVAIIVA